MIGVAVRAQVEEERVLVAIHLRRHAAQRPLEIGDAGDGKFLERVLAVDERDGMPRRAEALVEELAHIAHLFYEYVLARVGCKADKVELAHAGAAGLDCRQSALDELSLQVEKALVGERRRLLVLRRQPDVGARKSKEADRDHRG